jgi:hypothetical protein
MTCNLGHDHPPVKVVGATENPMQPWGPRPYHCPDCFYVTKQGAVPGYWVKYPVKHCRTQRDAERTENART